jgi:hypothetical protein
LSGFDEPETPRADYVLVRLIGCGKAFRIGMRGVPPPSDEEEDLLATLATFAWRERTHAGGGL